jgi:N-acylneuraminate cytidylyltransferase
MKIVIIPARGGSKRIKNKNIIDFCGRPMISYALEAAKKTGIFDKIHVSTESVEIKNIVEALGYAVDFIRPSELADDLTGIVPVLKWVLNRYAAERINFEDVCCLMPVCPLIDSADISSGYKEYLDHDRKYPLHCVAPFPVPIEWAFRRDKKGFLIPVSPGSFAVRSQDLEKAYYECGPFSFFNSSHILSDLPVSDRDFISIVLPRERAVDVDEPEDLFFAESLYLAKLGKGKC